MTSFWLFFFFLNFRIKRKLKKKTNIKKKEKKEDLSTIGSSLTSVGPWKKITNTSFTPATYFATACSSLDHLTSAAIANPITEPPVHVIQPLLIILHLVLPRISAAVLNKERQFLSQLLFRLQRSSPLLSSSAAVWWLFLLSIKQYNEMRHWLQTFGCRISLVLISGKRNDISMFCFVFFFSFFNISLFIYFLISKFIKKRAKTSLFWLNLRQDITRI